MSSKQHQFLTNAEALCLPQGHDAHFGVFKTGWDAGGQLEMRLGEQMPVVTLRPLDGHPSINKGEFKGTHNAIAKGEVLNAEQQAIVDAFGGNKDVFHERMRTVGCGTNMFFQFSDGTILQAAVSRTTTGPDGTVGLGNLSRAAGGAETDIPDAQVREATEEMNLFIKEDNGALTLLNIDLSDHLVSNLRMSELWNARRQGLQRYAAEINKLSESGYNNWETMTLQGRSLQIPGLHQMVTQDIFGKRTSFAAVYADEAANGDISGIDRVVLVVMPDGIRPDQLRCVDGELDKGQPLFRTWEFKTPTEWKVIKDKPKAEGGRIFSNAPGKVVDQALVITSVIHSLGAVRPVTTTAFKPKSRTL